MQRTRLSRSCESNALARLTQKCENCDTYKKLFVVERKKKHLPVEPTICELRSATTRNPGSDCSTCNAYMALYATIRRRKPTNYGKITRSTYYYYKKMPKALRPPFYVRKSYGEFVTDESGTHFYEVEELTSHNPFKKRSGRKPVLKFKNSDIWGKPNLVPPRLLNSVIRHVYTGAVLPSTHQNAEQLPSFGEFCGDLLIPKTPELYELLPTGIFDNWPHEDARIALTGTS